MARAGISKYSVQKAHQTLMAQGVHPSIDAIRIELGNTGSKTTISRYLKELEAEESVQLEDEALLSDGIKAIVAQLASKLHQEANEVVKQSEGGFQVRIEALELENTQFKKQIESQAVEFQKYQINQEQLSDHNLELDKQLTQMKELLNHANGSTSQLEAVIVEKDKQINLLDENHQHTRDSLVHYRESVKDQREKEHRQFEQQVQQLQVEIRQLNQTLIVKQNDITSLNKDNSRLVTELGNVQKQLISVESKQSQSVSDRQLLESEQRNLSEKLTSSSNQLEKIKIDYQEIFEDNRAKEVELKKSEQSQIKLEAMVTAKNELLSQFQAIKVGSS